MLGKEDNVERNLSEAIDILKKQGVSSERIIELVTSLARAASHDEIRIPLSVFKNDSLSSLETIVKYMRENLLLTFRQIGELTGRNSVSLAVTYRNSKKKLEHKFLEQYSVYTIPVSILKDRKLSVLENIAWYLKETFSLTYHSVAVLLNRDDRTIWTVYQRAKSKRGKKS